MIEKIVILIMCHILGDYIFSTEYIATSKGENWYHMFVHCVTYCIPFAIIFGIDKLLLCIFITHFIIDTYKARYGFINYITDQVMHYVVLSLYLCI